MKGKCIVANKQDGSKSKSFSYTVEELGSYAN